MHVFYIDTILPSESTWSSNLWFETRLTSIGNNGDDCLLAIINADSRRYIGTTGWAPASSKTWTISLHTSYLIASSKLVWKICIALLQLY